MDVVVEPEVDPALSEVVRASVARAALDVDPRHGASAWWRAGVADALERTPAGPAYDAARSPRSTRGATRA